MGAQRRDSFIIVVGSCVADRLSVVTSHLPAFFAKHRWEQLFDNIDDILDDLAAIHKVITNVSFTKLSQCTEKTFS